MAYVFKFGNFTGRHLGHNFQLEPGFFSVESINSHIMYVPMHEPTVWYEAENYPKLPIVLVGTYLDIMTFQNAEDDFIIKIDFVVWVGACIELQDRRKFWKSWGGHQQYKIASSLAKIWERANAPPPVPLVPTAMHSRAWLNPRMKEL